MDIRSYRSTGPRGSAARTLQRGRALRLSVSATIGVGRVLFRVAGAEGRNDGALELKRPYGIRSIVTLEEVGSAERGVGLTAPPSAAT